MSPPHLPGLEPHSPRPTASSPGPRSPRAALSPAARAAAWYALGAALLLLQGQALPGAAISVQDITATGTAGSLAKSLTDMVKCIVPRPPIWVLPLLALGFGTAAILLLQTAAGRSISTPGEIAITALGALTAGWAAVGSTLVHNAARAASGSWSDASIHLPPPLDAPAQIAAALTSPTADYEPGRTVEPPSPGGPNERVWPPYTRTTRG